MYFFKCRKTNTRLSRVFVFLSPRAVSARATFITGSSISRYIGYRGSIILSITFLGFAMCSSIAIWYEVIYGGCEV